LSFFLFFFAKKGIQQAKKIKHTPISGKVMQPILTTTDDTKLTQSNGYVKQQQQHTDEMNGTKSSNTTQQQQSEEKVVLPVEMACMVPLRTLIGKLIHKSHSDLMTLTDT
jgi:hypothetical protein